MKTCLRSLLALVACLGLSPVASAAVCTTDTLANYTALGFSCTLGDLQFSGFRATANFTGSDSFRTGNAPDAITVTPQIVDDEVGFAFSNLNASFTGFLSNTTLGAEFDVAALSGDITGASVHLGTHSFVAPQGQVRAAFGEFFNAFAVIAQHDSSVEILSASTTFPALTSFRAGSSASAVVTGFDAGSSAFVDAYTVLLSVTAIPEPESYALLLAGLGLLGFAARGRRPARAAVR